MKKTWGERNYPEERLALFWRGFEKTPNDWFISAVDSLIATHRNAPMIDEIAKAVDLAKNRHYSDRQSRDMAQVISDAGIQSKADPDLKDACIKTLREFTTGKISRAVFNEACDALYNLAEHIARGKRMKTPGREVYNQ